jgi:hypothetical protein
VSQSAGHPTEAGRTGRAVLRQRDRQIVAVAVLPGHVVEEVIRREGLARGFLDEIRRRVAVDVLALCLTDELIEFVFDECRNALAISPECGVECLLGFVIDPIVSLEYRVFGDLRMVHADDAD